MKVDIIMRTKDRPIFLKRAIKDVMAQSYKQWHLCIVNDSPNKKTVEDIVKKSKLDKNQLTLIHNTKKIPQDALINVGIKKTKNELIVVHDDDDTWHPDFLKKCVAKLKEPIGYAEVGGVAVKTQMIYEKIKGTEIKVIKKRLWHCHYEPDPIILLTKMAKSNQIPIMSFTFYRKCLEKVGYFNETLPVHGDWEFLLRFMANFDILFIEDVLAYYHIRIKGQGSSGNTVTNLTHKHRLYHDLIVNKYIREDIKNNKVGLGNILAQAEFFKRLEKDLPVTFKINRLLKRIKRFILRR